jgi:glutamate 5-kinase
MGFWNGEGEVFALRLVGTTWCLDWPDIRSDQEVAMSNRFVHGRVARTEGGLDRSCHIMKRVIIKIGTKVLSCEDGTLDEAFLAHLVEQVVVLRNRGMEVVLVSSGAVGAGKSLIKLKDDMTEVVRKQVYAAVGQVKLMSAYAELFARHDYHCAQVLAAKEDFRDEEHYRNMQNCFEGLLLDNVIPIVNENDVVATTELLFTDNDELAGLVARQLQADCLIILTSTDGIFDDRGKTITKVTVSNVEKVIDYITPDKSTGGRGGMVSKFKTARDLSERGVAVSIVNGRRPNVLVDAVDGAKVGTRIALRESLVR